MKSSRIRLLAASLIAAFAFTSTFTFADSGSSSPPPPDKGRFVMPYGFSLNTGDRILSFEDELDEEDASEQSVDSNRLFTPGSTEKAWLLEPDVFGRLSSAGQRAALAVNGKLRVRRPGGQVSAMAGVFAQATAGDNIRVNNPALDTNFHTHSETSISVNGSNMIISFNEFDFNGYAVSTDGGNTWSHRRTPDPPGGFNLGDGVVAFGPSGECYYAGLAFMSTGSGGTRSTIGVAKSTNNGATFSTPFDAGTTASNTTDMQDKEWIAVDKTNSAFKGNVYASWTDFTPSGSFINFSRSTNGGSTFEAPVALSPQDGSRSVQGSVPVVGPNGDLFVAFSDSHLAIGGIGIVKSTDGGKTFSPEQKVVSVIGSSTLTGGGGVRNNSFPSVTIDANGALHMVYDSLTVSQLDRSDTFYVRSTDGGITFSSPLKLNDDATTTAQVFPSIAVTPDGTIGVKWWDRRNDPNGDSLTDVYMTISHDGGASFGKNFRVSDHNWTFGPIEPGFAGGYHGDYDGIAADGSNFFLSWSDERNGEADAYFAQEPAVRDPNSQDFNISATKPFANLIAGNSVAFDLNTSSVNGFSGSVSFATPAGAGFSYAFANASVNAGDTAHLTVSTSPGVQPGAYLITVTAGGAGLTRKTNLRLNVLSPARFAGVPSNASRTKGFTSLQAGLKVDTSGTIHTVFDDDSVKVRSNEAFYSQSTDGGMSFSNPVKVSGTSSLATQSTLALDSAGNPYIAWTGVNPTPANGTFATFVLKSTDHGNTFSTPVLASGAVRSAQSPKIAVDKNGNITVVFVDNSVSGIPVFAVRSTDGGTTFTAPARISQTGESVGNPPFVAVDSNGAAYVVYQDSAQSISTIKMAVASDGQNFGLPKVISDNQVTAFAPQIAIDRQDNVYATFYDRFGSTSQTFNREIIVTKSTDKGNTFGPQVNVSNNSGQATFPSLIVGDQGRVSVAWEDTTDDPQRDVLVARSTDGGVTFDRPVNLSANSARSFGAFGGTDANGNLFVAWTDDVGANTDVYLASLSPSALGPPDFTLSSASAALTAQRGTRVQVPVTVNRFAGFAGNVTLTPPDLAGLKAKGVNFTTTANGGVLSFKLKGGGVTGPQVLTFTGQDDTGRTRLYIFALVIQPAQ